MLRNLAALWQLGCRAVLLYATAAAAAAPRQLLTVELPPLRQRGQHRRHSDRGSAQRK